MKILAIETSCDETAIAIADFSGSRNAPKVKILANIVSSQVSLHREFGGVVPNLAKREHQKNLPLILFRALKQAGMYGERKGDKDVLSAGQRKTLEQIFTHEPELLEKVKKRVAKLTPPGIDAIAVTYGPGLAPALWVGVNFARALAYLWGVPLLKVNHMAGHLYSALLQAAPRISNFQFPISKKNSKSKLQILKIQFPLLALLVSGGHTELVLVRRHGKFKIIGETLDDAVGEAFDKVARMLGFSYPGGPAISAFAEIAEFKHLNIKKFKFPRPMLHSGDFNFSFSGLKTAVLYFIRELRDKKSVKKFTPVIAREFQDAAIDVLVAKTADAAKKTCARTVSLGGGVAANKLLQRRLTEELTRRMPEAEILFPDVSLTGDNALMIALAAYFTGKKIAPKRLGADANIRIDGR